MVLAGKAVAKVALDGVLVEVVGRGTEVLVHDELLAVELHAGMQTINLESILGHLNLVKLDRLRLEVGWRLAGQYRFGFDLGQIDLGLQLTELSLIELGSVIEFDRWQFGFDMPFACVVYLHHSLVNEFRFLDDIDLGDRVFLDDDISLGFEVNLGNGLAGVDDFGRVSVNLDDWIRLGRFDRIDGSAGDHLAAGAG